MRRLIWIGLFVAIVPWIVIGIVREATDNDTLEHYYVRAIFDNAANLVQGEDVKIAGVPVGVVQSLEVTDDKKAAVTLRIDDEDFTPWKSDASCVIRPQGLIGEKFVECKPGTTSGKPLAQIQSGDGEGERSLPVSNTSSPVDIDLLNDILRLPYRERFAILLSEFGTGLARWMTSFRARTSRSRASRSAWSRASRSPTTRRPPSPCASTTRTSPPGRQTPAA